MIIQVQGDDMTIEGESTIKAIQNNKGEWQIEVSFTSLSASFTDSLTMADRLAILATRMKTEFRANGHKVA